MVFKKTGPARREWNSTHRKILERGGPCLPGQPPEFFKRDGKLNEEAIREAWEHFRLTIMQEWNTAGRRPKGWWAFDASEHRDRDRDEAEQLEAMGELSDAELRQLADRAREENERLHASNYIAKPFRRGWSFWRFVHRRNLAISEAEQLQSLDELTTYEKAIVANPAGALAGLLGGRSRFGYLSESEMKLLRLPHISLD